MRLINLFAFCILISMASCNSDDGPEIESELNVPMLVSSTPENSAMDVSVSTVVVELGFNYEIIVVSKSRILVNGIEASAVLVNGKSLNVTLPPLDAETSYTVTVNKMAVKAVDGVVNSEEISISFTTGEKVAVAHSSLVIDNPSSEVTNLYDFLIDNYGTKIISSTIANVNWNINEAEWVKLHTGKYPAMATFDYIHLPFSPSNWIDYSTIDFVKDWWNNNGIVSASWHWLVPPTQSETDLFEYTYKYTTTFKASNVPVDGTWENTVAKADFDKLIGYIKLLQDENIPMIWRPLHEAAGNIYAYNNGTAWFWWGADGAEAYKTLWQFMFNYFKAEGINNLIWVWTTQTNDDAFYPGDEYVDIIGRDIYNNSDVEDISAQFKLIQKTYPNKMVTLSECGSVVNISTQWTNGAKWSYFMPWYDHDRTNDINEADFTETDHEHANAAWWKDAMSQEYVITRDKMPSLK